MDLSSSLRVSDTTEQFWETPWDLTTWAGTQQGDLRRLHAHEERPVTGAGGGHHVVHPSRTWVRRSVSHGPSSTITADLGTSITPNMVTRTAQP